MAHPQVDVQPKEPPCRTCVDFKSWSRVQKKNLESSNVTNAKQQEKPQTTTERPQSCPLDKDGLGRATWGLLHTMAAYYPDKPSQLDKMNMTNFLSILSQTYPCEICAQDMQVELKKSPPVTTSQSALSQWLCDFHNIVNVKLGKPKFDCSTVNMRWRDGWLDGSCD